MDRLNDAEKILRDILQSDGGAYDLEPRQSAAIMAFLGGASLCDMERAALSGRDIPEHCDGLEA